MYNSKRNFAEPDKVGNGNLSQFKEEKKSRPDMKAKAKANSRKG